MDGARVEQVLENLLANAHPACARRDRRCGSPRALDATGPERCVRCTVEDEGPGLPAEDLARIFEPFFSRRKGGTGLGLSIVQRMVEAHGGRITAENREEGAPASWCSCPSAAGAPEGADA